MSVTGGICQPQRNCKRLSTVTGGKDEGAAMERTVVQVRPSSRGILTHQVHWPSIRKCHRCHLSPRWQVVNITGHSLWLTEALHTHPYHIILIILSIHREPWDNLPVSQYFFNWYLVRQCPPSQILLCPFDNKESNQHFRE